MTAVDPLLKAREVADILQVSVLTVYRRIADGTLPKPIKLGSTARWPASEIIAALQAAGDRRAS